MLASCSLNPHEAKLERRRHMDTAAEQRIRIHCSVSVTSQEALPEELRVTTRRASSSSTAETVVESGTLHSNHRRRWPLSFGRSARLRPTARAAEIMTEGCSHLERAPADRRSMSSDLANEPRVSGMVLRQQRESQNLRDMAGFLHGRTPPPHNYMSTPDPYAADAESASSARGRRWSAALRSIVSRRRRKSAATTAQKQQIKLPDSAVAGTTTGGHRHIVISIPVEYSQLEPEARSQYPVFLPDGTLVEDSPSPPPSSPKSPTSDTDELETQQGPRRPWVADRGLVTVLRPVAEVRESLENLKQEAASSSAHGAKHRLQRPRRRLAYYQPSPPSSSTASPCSSGGAPSDDGRPSVEPPPTVTGSVVQLLHSSARATPMVHTPTGTFSSSPSSSSISVPQFSPQPHVRASEERVPASEDVAAAAGSTQPPTMEQTRRLRHTTPRDSRLYKPPSASTPSAAINEAHLPSSPRSQKTVRPWRNGSVEEGTGLPPTPRPPFAEDVDLDLRRVSTAFSSSSPDSTVLSAASAASPFSLSITPIMVVTDFVPSTSPWARAPSPSSCSISLRSPTSHAKERSGFSLHPAPASRASRKSGAIINDGGDGRRLQPRQQHAPAEHDDVVPPSPVTLPAMTAATTPHTLSSWPTPPESPIPPTPPPKPHHVQPRSADASAAAPSSPNTNAATTAAAAMEAANARAAALPQLDRVSLSRRIERRKQHAAAMAEARQARVFASLRAEAAREGGEMVEDHDYHVLTRAEYVGRYERPFYRRRHPHNMAATSSPPRAPKDRGSAAAGLEDLRDQQVDDMEQRVKLLARSGQGLLASLVPLLNRLNRSIADQRVGPDGLATDNMSVSSSASSSDMSISPSHRRSFSAVVTGTNGSIRQGRNGDDAGALELTDRASPASSDTRHLLEGLRRHEKGSQDRQSQEVILADPADTAEEDGDGGSAVVSLRERIPAAPKKYYRVVDTASDDDAGGIPKGPMGGHRWTTTTTRSASSSSNSNINNGSRSGTSLHRSSSGESGWPSPFEMVGVATGKQGGLPVLDGFDTLAPLMNELRSSARVSLAEERRGRRAGHAYDEDDDLFVEYGGYGRDEGADWDDGEF